MGLVAVCHMGLSLEIGPVSHALAGGFFTTEPPGKPRIFFFFFFLNKIFLIYSLAMPQDM